MTRAILITTVLLLLGIAGAVGSLWLRRTPASARGAAPFRPPVLAPDADGSLYDLRLELAAFQERLADAERAARRARDDVAVLARERDELRRELHELQAEVARLRRALAHLPERSPTAHAPANAPLPPRAPGPVLPEPPR